MAKILRVISNDLYQNLVERNLISPTISSETEILSEDNKVDDILPGSPVNTNPTTKTSKDLCKKYKFWEPFDTLFKGIRK